MINRPLVSQRHLLGFLIAALDLAAAVRLVAVGAVCQGGEMAGRPELAPGVVLPAAGVSGLGSRPFNNSTERLNRGCEGFLSVRSAAECVLNLVVSHILDAPQIVIGWLVGKQETPCN